MTDPFLEIISEICQEEGIKLTLLSHDWLKQLTRGDQVRYILGYKFGLNPQSSAAIADDKFATFSVLAAAELPVIPHSIFYEPSNQSDYAKGYNSLEYLGKQFEAYGRHIVIKPNNGTRIEGVLEIRDPSEFAAALPIVFRYAKSASICPFCQIRHQYRFVILDSEVRLVYLKPQLPIPTPANPTIIREPLNDTDTTPDTATVAQLSSLALYAASALGLRFCSVDIVETPDNFQILEVNSGVMVSGFLRRNPAARPEVKQLYRDAILRML